MGKAHTKRGGDTDGPRSRPKAKVENKKEKLLGDELDDSFPASDPPASTQPLGIASLTASPVNDEAAN